MIDRKYYYMISIYHGGGNDGIAPLYRTTSKKDWLQKIEDMIGIYKIQASNCRVVEYDDKTIFSFPATIQARPLWLAMEYVRQPLSVHYGFPSTI